LPAGVCDIADLGVEDEKMSKQELAHIARLMYDLQEYCRRLNIDFTYTYLLHCEKCPLDGLDCTQQSRKIPMVWHITEADIERLECESNDD
jgi:hypothetical protein